MKQKYFSTLLLFIILGNVFLLAQQAPLSSGNYWIWEDENGVRRKTTILDTTVIINDKPYFMYEWDENMVSLFSFLRFSEHDSTYYIYSKNGIYPNTEAPYYKVGWEVGDTIDSYPDLGRRLFATPLGTLYKFDLGLLISTCVKYKTIKMRKNEKCFFIKI